MNFTKLVFVRRRGFDEVDAVEKHSLEIGQEWPDGEDPGVARYRLFYQVYNKNSDLLHHLLYIFNAELDGCHSK